MFKSIKTGKIAEEIVTNIMSSAGFVCTPSPPRTIGFDVACESKDSKFTIEVKYDVMSERTGNVAIEFWNSRSNKPSGILATQADFWCHVLGGSNEVWMNKVHVLKSFIDKNKPIKTIFGGGDKNSNMYIYQKDLFCSSMIRIDRMTGEELKCLMCG